jgi:hypothetical protein
MQENAKKKKNRDISKANLLISEWSKGSLSVALNGLQINFMWQMTFHLYNAQEYKLSDRLL